MDFLLLYSHYRFVDTQNTFPLSPRFAICLLRICAFGQRSGTRGINKMLSRAFVKDLKQRRNIRNK